MQKLFEMEEVSLQFTDGSFKDIIKESMGSKSRSRGLRTIFAIVKGCTMRHFTKNMDQHFGVACLLFWLAALWGFFIPTPAICDNSVADEIISLNVTDRPLVEVLENISIAAGCQFSIDESWEDYPITASFANEPLHRGLKRVFRNINNAIIYGADRTIRIIIYDEATPSGKAIGHSVTIKSSQEPILQFQPSSEATAPQAELGDPEDSSDAENIEQSTENTADSNSESDEADAENTEAKEEESGEAAAEKKTAALETEHLEHAPEQESNQTEETESSFDNSENSEEMESGGESNQN